VRDRHLHDDSVRLIANVLQLPLQSVFIYLRDVWVSFYHTVPFPSFLASTIPRVVRPFTYEATQILKRRFSNNDYVARENTRVCGESFSFLHFVSDNNSLFLKSVANTNKIVLGRKRLVH